MREMSGISAFKMGKGSGVRERSAGICVSNEHEESHSFTLSVFFDTADQSSVSA